MTDQLVVACTRVQAEQIVNYDHHRVWIEGRSGIMLTYHWMPLDDATEPLALIIVFHESAKQHPPAPPQIQAVIDWLIVGKKTANSSEKRPQMGL